MSYHYPSYDHNNSDERETCGNMTIISIIIDTLIISNIRIINTDNSIINITLYIYLGL